jgi:hypothetical protein
VTATSAITAATSISARAITLSRCYQQWCCYAVGIPWAAAAAVLVQGMGTRQAGKPSISLLSCWQGHRHIGLMVCLITAQT